MKRRLCMLLAVVMLMAAFAGCSGGGTSKASDTTTEAAGSAASTQAPEAEKYEIEMVLVETEYTKQIEDVWKLYTEEHPNITFKMSGWTEGQDAVYEARIAAGDPPHIFENAPANPVTKDRYDFLYNLLELDYPYWNNFSFNAKTYWGDVYGIKEYLPILPMWNPVNRTFIYYADEMEKAGLNPKQTVKSIDDLKDFLKQLKAYIDKEKNFQYVFDLGWNPNGFSRGYTYAFTTALASLDEQYAVWEGKVRWDDMEKSPYVKSLTLLKEFYDLGYFPKNFWTRQWEPDYEAGFIAKKSMLTWHGPWLWDKVLAANPDAKLDGFTLPPNKDGLVGCDSFSGDDGTGIFKAHEGKPIFEEVKKAFIWYNSPEVIKMRAEIRGRTPAFNLVETGLPDLQGMQFKQVLVPFEKGEFGNYKWDLRMWPDPKVGKFKVNGKPEVFRDDAMAAVWGDYFTGKITLQQFLQTLQKRWEEAYKFN